MKNIHILPTDKPSSLYILGNNELKLRYTIDLPIDPDIAVNLHIYITSDKEIKAKDWIISKSTGELIKSSKSYCANNEYGKKIILTTDQSLDGIQAIDDEFLEWFVKNPSCEEVETYSLGVKNQLTGESGHYKYEIIIPKEENSIEAKQRAKNYMSLKGALEPKQETLEEAAERVSKEHYVDQSDYWAVGVDSVKRGAKWQEERMYSEEDMAESFMACWKANVPEGFECKLSFKEWFEQFKKK